jgi:hypothetical protein
MSDALLFAAGDGGPEALVQAMRVASAGLESV